MEDKFIQLTSAVYRLLDFFPDGEPLKNRAKDKALEITESLVKNKTSTKLAEDIEVLLDYLKLAKSFGWIDSINFLIISKEYENIRNQINVVSPDKDKLPEKVIDHQLPKKQSKAPEFLISERQKKILQILREKGKAQVSDFKTVLIDVTKRTIRRDLDELLKNKEIIRVGEWNQVFYKATPMSEIGESQGGVGGTGLMS